MPKLRRATVLTWIAALAIAGGIVKLALDDEIVVVAVPEPAPPGAPEGTTVDDPSDPATHVAAAFAPAPR